MFQNVIQEFDSRNPAIFLLICDEGRVHFLLRVLEAKQAEQDLDMLIHSLTDSTNQQLCRRIAWSGFDRGAEGKCFVTRTVSARMPSRINARALGRAGLLFMQMIERSNDSIADARIFLRQILRQKFRRLS